MYSRIGAAAYKKDLTNTISLCNALDNPQLKFKSVHIAGTNGKGSASHALAAIMQTAGYKTGLYTSPHLKDFRERIKIDGKEIEEQFVVDFTKQITPQIEAIEPSFFEITVAMAFTWFAQQQVDIAIIEVGLGGRLDSTNIITPEVCLITNISMDHAYLLGNTVQLIAAEKAGIIKPGVPVVISESDPKTKQLFIDKAMQEGASISFADEERWATEWTWDKGNLVTTIARQLHDERKTYRIDLPGVYQLKNMIGVLEVSYQLQQKGFKVSDEHVQYGLAHIRKLTGLHGRWEQIRNHPKVVLDVGHNEAGITQIVHQLQHEVYNTLHIVFGMVKDKEIDNILALLPKNATYYFTKSSIPRALAEAELMEAAGRFQLNGHCYPTVMTAYDAALTAAHSNDLVLICGSVFIVGEIIS